jgi:aspartate-semialdehyde dehydrogenase
MRAASRLHCRSPCAALHGASEAANRDTVYVGGIREDLPPDGGLNLWIVADDANQAAAISYLPILEALSSGARALASRAI